MRRYRQVLGCVQSKKATLQLEKKDAGPGPLLSAAADPAAQTTGPDALVESGLAVQTNGVTSEKTPLLNRFTKAFHSDDKIHFPPDYLDKMLDVEAAVGLVQLVKCPKIVAQRRENTEWYANSLPLNEDWVMPPIVQGATYSHYVVRVHDRLTTVSQYARKGFHLGELIQYAIPDTSPYKASGAECANSRVASRSTISFPVTELAGNLKSMERH